MNHTLKFFVLLGAALVCWGLTWCVRKYSLSREIMDIPNARSSHRQPTPRGGGVAFVIAFLVFGAASAWHEDLAMRSFMAVAGAGAWVAMIGFLDDHGHIKARWRLLAHAAAAAWVLIVGAHLPAVTVLGVNIAAQWLWVGFWALYMVWMLNLYNFMDGIDGLAAGQAVFVAGGGAVLYWVVGRPADAWMPLLLAASVLGFLVWNFPPARIFMGDAGSGFLGITLAVLSLQATAINMNLFWGWLILSGVFIVDATFTLLRRLLKGGRIYEAHRTHAYQYASRKWKAHRPVTLGVYALNALWLLPLAMWVAVGKLTGEIGLILAYVPLLALATYFGAGKPEAAEIN